MPEKQVPDVNYKGSKDDRSGCFVTYTQIAIAVVVVIIITVSVGLIAGLTGNAGSGNQQSTVATTVMSTTQKATVAPTKGPTVKPTTPAPPPYAALGNPRLPTTIKPSEYYFELDVDMTALTFTGSNVIRFQVTTPTNLIIVHIDGITVTSTPQVSTDRYFNTGIQTVNSHGTYSKNSYHYTVMGSNLSAGTYYIRYVYSASLATDLNGFYKYQYTRAADRATVWAAASQLEDFYARRVLPCFDEPAMKATFQANITVPSNYSALWNTRRTGMTTMGNKKRFEFATKTPVMSTYLMAFTVDDFVSVNATTQKGTLVRVFSRPGIQQDSMYALGAAVNITEFFEGLFGINYQMGKQDHISVPSFAAGAMENWGLILYREELLSYNKYYINSNGLESIVTVISHELAHMWFGNYATLQWWNHLWLNEAFANFFQNFGAAQYEPSMYLMQQFVLDSVHRGLATDASPLSHPIVPPATFGPFFDRITYQKGGSVLRMFRDYLGNDNFFTGLRAYLNAYAYNNAITKQLFASMTGAINQPPFNISEFMGPWVYQMGYPVITLARDPNNPNQGIMTQQRYLSDKSATPNQEHSSSSYTSAYNYKWTVPVKYYDQGSSAVRLSLFRMTSASQTVPWTANNWIKLNANQIGFYRVMYPTANWNLIASALQNNLNTLLNTDRANVLDDAFAFALTKRLPITIPLSLTKYMTKEINHLPWTVVSNNFFLFQLRLSNRASYQHFAKYYMKISAPPAEMVQFRDTGSWMGKSARYTILNSACGVGYVPCVNNASAILASYIMDKVANNVPGSYRTIVFRYGIAYGGVAEWDALYNEMRMTLDITDRGRILNALSYSRQPWVLRRFLNYSMDPTKIPAASTIAVFTFVSRNPVGRYLAWDYFRENHAFIKQKYGSTRPLLSTVTQYFNDQFRLTEVQNYISANPETSGTAKITEAVVKGRIQRNIQFLTDYEKPMSDWFMAN